MNFGIEGKYALVTGGSHGIGRNIALSLAREGCNVAICARNSERPGYSKAVDKTVKEIKSLGVSALGFYADVLVTEDIDRVMAGVIRSWGTIHILVNNVGGGGRWGEPSIEATEERVWEEVYNKNTMAAVRFTKKAIPYMRHQQWGRVVTITSVHGREAGGRPWYNMAKTAQTSLMKNLGTNPDLTREGITFNSVAPGSIMIPDTGWETSAKNDPVAHRELLDREFPLGRLGRPEEVASVVCFICSEQASLVTGASIPVDGGESRSF